MTQFDFSQRQWATDMDTRNRRLRLINSFGTFALDRAVKAAFARRGARWLTDEQLDDIARDLMGDYIKSRRHNRRERERRAMEAAS